MIMKNCDADMEKVCRSCMSVSSEMRSVFDKNEISNGNSLQLSDMIMACAAVQIEEDDGLPSHLCSGCEVKLLTAYTFKKQCEKSDATFRALTPETLAKVVIKQECLENLDIVVQAEVDNDSNTFDENNFSDSSYGNEEKPSKRDCKQSKDFTCNFCYKVLRTKKGLKIHIRRHTGEKLRTCDICAASFTKSDHLVRHMRIHNTEENQKYICVECGAGFTTAYHLSKHKKDHNVNKNQEFEEEEEDIEEDYDIEIINSKCFSDNDSEDTTKTNKNEENNLTSRQRRQAKLDQMKKKKVMECEFCDRKFKYRKSFVHHIQVEHGMPDDCDAAVSPADSKHKVNKEKVDSVPDDKVSEEVISDVPKNDRAELRNLIVIDKSTKVHTCHVCDSSFDRMNHLTKHMTMHRAVLKHKCDRCEKAFASEDHLTKHIEEDHTDKPYVCSICKSNFVRGEHLIRHLRVHETNAESVTLTCSICDKAFNRCNQLARHTKLHLQQDKRHVCTECGKAFNRLDNLKTHQRIHSGVKDNSKLHLCIYCGKEFNNSSNMIVHMRRHTGERPYKCSQCGKGFPRSHDLKCHERIHSGEKPYLCTLCGKSFNKSNKLLRHSRVHTGERPYECNLCGRAFTQSNDLVLHTRRHTGSRPYACGGCPARFIQSGQLKNHQRTTGHWMETQPELKGGHRVEPVTPATKPAPIKFKTHGKNVNTNERITKEEGEIEMEEPRILTHTVGIMGNINIQTNVHQPQPIIIDSSKLLGHFPNLVSLASVVNAHQNIDKVETVEMTLQSNSKYKEEIENYVIEEKKEDDEEDAKEGNETKTIIASFPTSSVFASGSDATVTFTTTSEAFTYQTFR